MPGIYLEPVGLLYGSIARDAIANGWALPLAGGSIAFGAMRLWEGQAGNVKHAVVRLSTIRAIDDSRVKELLERIVAPRAPILGVSMDWPRIVGIVNVTPDSFSDGGEWLDPQAAIDHAAKLAADGADFIDVGGESTRPGADPISAEEELRRVLPVLRGLSKLGMPLSIDTHKPQVMREAVAAGAAMLNDVSALTYAHDSLATAASLKKPIVLMHSKGEPKTMQDNPVYADVVIEVYDYLESRLDAATAAGLSRDAIIADPGIGFGKSVAHNAALLRSMSVFHGLGVPLLAGTSRKSFFRKLTGARDPKARDAASVAAVFDAISQGVQFVRVHDVAGTRDALSVWDALRRERELDGESAQPQRSEPRSQAGARGT
jgi:dihydropteroate synthase